MVKPSLLEELAEGLADTFEKIVNPQGHYERASEGNQDKAARLANEEFEKTGYALKCSFFPILFPPFTGGFWMHLGMTALTAFHYAKDFEGDPCAFSVVEKVVEQRAFFGYGIGIMSSLMVMTYCLQTAKYLSLRDHLKKMKRENQ